MIQAISSEGGAQSARFAQGRRSQRTEGNSTQVKANTSRTGRLDVTTADGDRVSISFSALQRLEAGQSQVRTRRGSATTQDASQSSEVQVELKVDGSLSDQEVSDIARLLQSLAGAVNGQKSAQDSAYNSLANFQFQYKTQTDVQYGSAHSYLG